MNVNEVPLVWGLISLPPTLGLSSLSIYLLPLTTHPSTFRPSQSICYLSPPTLVTLLLLQRKMSPVPPDYTYPFENDETRIENGRLEYFNPVTNTWCE